MQENSAKFITKFNEFIHTNDVKLFATEEQIDTISKELGAVSPSELRAAVREFVIGKWSLVHANNAIETAKRKVMEDKLSRRYFHTMKVDDMSLKAWREFIQLEEDEQKQSEDTGISPRLVSLYERCIVVTALYEEFWLRYATYLEPHDVEKARSVVERGATAQVFPTPSYAFAHAWFEEAHDNVPFARTALKQAIVTHDSSIESYVKLANFEKRHGNIEKGKEVFDQALTTIKAKGEAKSTKHRLYVYAAYAHFLSSGGADVHATDIRKLFNAALVLDSKSKLIFSKWVDFEVSLHIKQKTIESEALVEAVFQEITIAELAKKDALMFRKRRIMFLDEHGVTFSLLRAAQTDIAESQTRGLEQKKKSEDDPMDESNPSQQQHEGFQGGFQDHVQSRSHGGGGGGYKRPYHQSSGYGDQGSSGYNQQSSYGGGYQSKGYENYSQSQGTYDSYDRSSSSSSRGGYSQDRGGQGWQ